MEIPFLQNAAGAASMTVEMSYWRHTLRQARSRRERVLDQATGNDSPDNPIGVELAIYVHDIRAIYNFKRLLSYRKYQQAAEAELTFLGWVGEDELLSKRKAVLVDGYNTLSACKLHADGLKERVQAVYNSVFPKEEMDQRKLAACRFHTLDALVHALDDDLGRFLQNITRASFDEILTNEVGSLTLFKPELLRTQGERMELALNDNERRALVEMRRLMEEHPAPTPLMKGDLLERVRNAAEQQGYGPLTAKELEQTHKIAKIDHRIYATRGNRRMPRMAG